MGKSVVLVLSSGHESEYGEHANVPLFNAQGDIIGWSGGEVPECGHPCEFNVLDDEGFTACASSTTVNKLRGENDKLRDMCSELYRRYWDVEGDFFIDPEMDELEGRLRKLGIETWETWE